MRGIAVGNCFNSPAPSSPLNFWKILPVFVVFVIVEVHESHRNVKQKYTVRVVIFFIIRAKLI